MAAGKQETVEMSQQSESCSVCLDIVQEVGERSIAKLKCGHRFHLDCIGSAFNAKGAMQCPNCRHVEDGNWLYANGSCCSNDYFNEEVPSGDDEHDYFYAHLSDELEGHDQDEPRRTLQSIWCPYENAPPQSAGRSYPPYLSSLGDSEGTRPFSPALLDTFLNIEDTDIELADGGFLFQRPTPEDSQSRPPAHGPDSHDSSMADRATVTERWSSTERGLHGWGRRGSVFAGQSGMPSPLHVNMQHNVVTATPMTDIDHHSGRMDTSGHLPSHHQTPASVWSSFVNERQVGFLPYHLWEVYENVRLRRVRGHELTRLTGSGSSSNARVSSNVVGSLAPHSHQRPVDSGSSPATTSHGSDSPAHSNNSTHGVNSTSHATIFSSSNDRAPWNYALPRSERCDAHDNHSGNSLYPEFVRQPVPNPSQAEISASSSAAAVGAASSSSSHYIHGTGGIRRVRTSFVSTRSTMGQPVLASAEQNRWFSSHCPWLNAAVANQEPPPVPGMEEEAIPSWVRDLNSTAPFAAFQATAAAELRSVVRFPSNGDSRASRGANSQSISVLPSTAELTAFWSEGQGGSPGISRGHPSRAVGRLGVLPNSYPYSQSASSEVRPPSYVFRPGR